MQRIKAISISDRKGVRKKNIDSALLVVNFGLENDAHGGDWHRQVSLLAEESIETMRQKGLQVVAGNFAENITTEGLDLSSLSVGTHIKLGKTELIISQLGKVCHNRCAIYHQAGDCVMPREGIFAVVIQGGPIQVNDEIEVLDTRSPSVALIGSPASEKAYGEKLQAIVQAKWQPGFVRFDQLNAQEDNLSAIFADLIDTQRIDTILLFDPPGRHGLIRPATPADSTTNLFYCRTLEEVEAL